MSSIWGPDIPGPPSIPGRDDTRPWLSLDALFDEEVLALSESPAEAVYFTANMILAVTRNWPPNELPVSIDREWEDLVDEVRASGMTSDRMRELLRKGVELGLWCRREEPGSNLVSWQFNDPERFWRLML